MSDFDKFFAEKLDEEGQFTRREKNWRALSKRLDAFDAGLLQKAGNVYRYLRYWQAAATCAVLTAGWLTWKMADMQREKVELNREISALEEKNSALEQEIAGLTASTNETPPPVGNITQSSENRSAFQQSGQSNEVKSSFSAFPVVAAADLPDRRPDSVTVPEVAVPLSPDSVLSRPETALQTIAALQLDTILQSSDQSTPDVLLLTASPKLIEPVRDPSRFRAGIQFATGLPVPQEKGVSWLIGTGVTAEYNLWRDFWLTASVDWLRFDVSTEKYIPKFHSHHHHHYPPQPGAPQQEKLVKVESTQRQQHFGMGVRYPLPVRAWVRPAVRVAYTMIRTSPEIITFKYEHPGWPAWPPGPPKPKYWVHKSEGQLIENVWRFGAGLEHETRDWTFGLWADYSKNVASSDDTFDVLMFRASVQYKFN